MAIAPAEIAHGPMLIGTVLNVLLYGIMITQLYLYHTSPARDRLFLQCFVYFLFLGDTIQTIFTIVYIYQSLIKHFDDVAYLTGATWVFASDPALTGILGGMVQAFFAWRIKMLTGRSILACIVFAFAISSLLLGIGTSIAIGIVPKFLEARRIKAAVIVWLASSSVADTLITTILVTFLKRHKTGFKKTDKHVDRIIRLTVQTGLITALWAAVNLLVYLLDPTGLHLLFNFPLSKLYTNSLMSSLNARGFWRSNGDDSTMGNVNNDTDLSLKTNVNVSLSHERGLGKGVFVDVESRQTVDRPEKPHRTSVGGSLAWEGPA